MRIDAISIGARAARLLSQRSDWAIAAVFERSFYLRSDDAFICIGDPSIGDGPLNVLIDAGSTSLFEAAARWVPGTSPGMTAVGLLKVEERGAFGLPDRTLLSLGSARVWQSPPWPQVAPGATSPDRLNDLLEATMRAAPPQSFIVSLLPSTPVDPLGRRARAGIDALRPAIVSRAAFDNAVSALAGLGHGLTPSGDDVLSGALIMLHALGRPEAAAALADSVRRQMHQLTSPLSCAFLEAACEGEPGAAVHRAIAALLNGAIPAEVIAPLRAIGHASGFDLLAGILLAAGA